MIKIIYVLSLLAFLFSCTGNILSDVASKTGDEDLLFEAQQKINQLNWDGAITIINTKMSVSAQASPLARETLASAYGGKCGLIFLDYVNALSAATTGSAMMILKTPFVGVAVDPSSCRLALATMELIGANGVRTTNQNFFTAILGMVLMGSALRNYVDNSPATGDGTNDVNICTGVTDAQMDDIIIGFGFMNENISAVSADAVGSGSLATLNGVAAACQAVGGSSCNVKDPSQITVPMRDFFRDLTNTIQYGIGTYDTGGSDVNIPNGCL